MLGSCWGVSVGKAFNASVASLHKDREERFDGRRGEASAARSGGEQEQLFKVRQERLLRYASG